MDCGSIKFAFHKASPQTATVWGQWSYKYYYNDRYNDRFARNQEYNNIRKKR